MSARSDAAGARPGRAPVRDVLLVAMTFASGAVDAVSFLGLGRVFTANMTGNIVLLGVAAGRGAGEEALRAGVALVAFAVAVAAVGRIAPGAEDGRAWPGRVTAALGIELVLQALFLVGWLASGTRPGGGTEDVLVAISGAAMGIQSSAVARLGVRGVTTTFVTGTLTGLLRALAAGAGHGPEHRRRAAVVAALVAGAGVGAALLGGPRAVAPAVPLAGTAAVIVVALTLGRREPAAGRGPTPEDDRAR